MQYYLVSSAFPAIAGSADCCLEFNNHGQGQNPPPLLLTEARSLKERGHLLT
jgi:hypothetical protein